MRGLIQKFEDTVHKNGKQPASYFKLLSMIIYSLKIIPHNIKRIQ